MKWKLVKCAPRAYSELIRSDIPGSSGARLARLHFLRSSPLSVMKPPVPKSSSPSISEPLAEKSTRGEIRFLLEVLANKKRSVKRKPLNSPEGCPPVGGKTLKVGALPSPSSTAGAGDSSGRADEPPLEVLPISVYCPMLRGTAPPPTMPDEVTGNHDRFDAAEDEDSLYFLMRSLLLGLFPPSCATPTLGGWVPCPSRRLWLFCFREPPLYVQVFSSIFFFIVSVRLDDFFIFIFYFLFYGRCLLMQKAWKGGPALPRDPPRQRSLTRLTLLP